MRDVLALLDSGSTELVERPVYGLTDAALMALAGEIQVVISRLTAAQANVVREVDGRGLIRASGSVNPAAWLRDRVHLSVAESRRVVALGALADRRDDLADVIRSGAVTTEQALAIGQVLDDIPTECEPAIVDKAAAILIDDAARFQPALLRKLGDRVLAHVAPEVADEQLRRRLDREDHLASRDRFLAISPDGRGRTILRGILDVESAAVVRAALEPLMAPVPRSPAGSDLAGSDPRTPGARRADALVDVCRLALRTGELPSDGGQPPQLSVIVDLEALTSRVGTGWLDTGEAVSAATIRRLACDARILPVVLNGAGIPVDVGRARRLFSGAARAAVVIRDGGCAFPGCDRPPRWCDVHHVVAWTDGGGTNRDNGVALCGHHHRLVHRDGWVVAMGVDQRPDFVPPPHVDPLQTPRRNRYHART